MLFRHHTFSEDLSLYNESGNYIKWHVQSNRFARPPYYYQWLWEFKNQASGVASRDRNLIATRSKVQTMRQTNIQTDGRQANFTRILSLPKMGMQAKTWKTGVFQLCFVNIRLPQNFLWYVKSRTGKIMEQKSCMFKEIFVTMLCLKRNLSLIRMIWWCAEDATEKLFKT